MCDLQTFTAEATEITASDNRLTSHLVLLRYVLTRLITKELKDMPNEDVFKTALALLSQVTEAHNSWNSEDHSVTLSFATCNRAAQIWRKLAESLQEPVDWEAVSAHLIGIWIELSEVLSTFDKYTCPHAEEVVNNPSKYLNISEPSELRKRRR